MRHAVLAGCLAALSLVALPAAPALAAPDKEAKIELDICVKTAGPVDLAIKDCYAALADIEDARLNRNWRALMQQVGGTRSPEGAALLAEQRAWLAFRDASCQHFVATEAPGTLDRLQAQICHTEIITLRADALGQLAQQYGALHGDDTP